MAGTLAIPTTFATLAPPTQPFALLDTALGTVATYINVRELSFGTLAARPAPGNHGAGYFATDTGQLFGDNGAAWVLMASSTTVGVYQTRGLVGVNNAGTPNTKYDLTSADFVLLRSQTDGTVIAKTAVGLFTCDLTVAQAVNGRDAAGALGTGAPVHFYYIVKADGTGLGSLGSASAPLLGPLLPAGYTHWAYAGAVWNAAGPALRVTYMRGPRMGYQAAQNAFNGASGTTENTVSLSTLVPANAETIDLAISINAQNVPDVFQLGVATGVYIFDQVAAATTGAWIIMVTIPNVGQQCFFKTPSLSRTVKIDVVGYTVPSNG